MKKSKGITFILLSMVALILTMPTNSQEPVPVDKNYAAWAQNFLRTMYPSLNDHKYVFSLDAWGNYDELGAQTKSLSMSVGEGPKGQYLKVIGGYAGFAPPPKDFHPGPQYFKQFLDAGFTFDESGRLWSFGASGPIVDQELPGTPYVNFLASNPDPTLDEVNAELKSEGAKYGPGQQAALEKALPLETLSHFLGKVHVIKVKPVSIDITPSGVVESVDWNVSIQVQQRDGSMLNYILSFDQFDGNLISLHRVPNSQVSDTTK